MRQAKQRFTSGTGAVPKAATPKQGKPENFTEVYNLSKSKKLLSMLLAMVMVFSTFVIGAQAGYEPYKDSAIKEYDSIDKPIFTVDQLATIALDAIDGMLADLDETSIKIPVINVSIEYSSVDNALNSLQKIYNGGVWNTVKSIAGDVGKRLSFAALNTDPKGNFAANGKRRETDPDVEVLYSVLAFLNDNSDLLADYGYGRLDLGPTLTGLLGDSIAEYLNAPLLIRTLVYDLAYDDDDPNYVDYEDLPDDKKPTIDAMLQIVVNDLLIDLEDELEESFEYGMTFDFDGIVDIANGSFYDQIEKVLQYAYNNVLVPMGNTKIKEWIYDLAQAKYTEDQKIYRYELDENGNQVIGEDGNPVKIKVGYYMDDTDTFKNLLKKEGYFLAGGEGTKSIYAMNAEAGNFHELASLVNLNYTIPTYEFAEGEQFLTSFNNILKTWLDVLVTAKTPTLVWEAGNNDMIITNLVNNAKILLAEYGEIYLGDYITIPDRATIEAFTLETAVVYFGRDAIDRYAANILLPDSADTVREILSFALCELIADLVPEEDVYERLQSGQLNPTSDDGWKQVLAIIARYYGNTYTNMNIPAGLNFEQTVSHAVDWALENYGGILYYTSQIDPNKTAWQKLDDVIFTLIPTNWLPANMRVLNADGSVGTVAIDGSYNILIEWLLGNILDLKIEHIFDVFDRNATGELNRSASYVLINRVTSILNAIIPNAIPTGLTCFDDIATTDTLGGIIKGLLSGLYSVRQSLIPGALPLVCMILDLTGDQALEDPSIDYPAVHINENLSLAGTKLIVKNNSTGVNTAYRNASQIANFQKDEFVQDKLYQVKITKIETNVPSIDVDFSGTVTLNGGEDDEFAVTGSLSNPGLVRFAVTYEILNEQGGSLTPQPITTYHFTYVSDTVSEEDKEYYSYETYTTEDGLEALRPTVFASDMDISHYIVNNPTSFVGSSQGWGGLRDLSFGLGRESTDETYNAKDSTVSLVGFNATNNKSFTGVDADGNPKTYTIFAQDADFKPFTTQRGGFYGDYDFADINVPTVEETDENGNTKTVDADLADYAGTYELTANLLITKVDDYYDDSNVTIKRKVVVFNDYNLPVIVSEAIGANRQAGNYTSASAWNTYLEALTAAQEIVLMPKTTANFDASVYQAAAENLTAAIEALEECGTSAGVADLKAALEGVEGNNPEGMEYDDPDYFFFADADYVLYTYNRYKEHANRLKSIIEAQEPTAPAEDASEEEWAEYEEKLANKPVLTNFEKTYRLHMFNMNSDKAYNGQEPRLVRKTITAASKNYLNYAYNFVLEKTLELNQEEYSTKSWEALQKAFDFADEVRADTNYAELRQSKINTARHELIAAYKGLTLASEDVADYTQLDAAILAADEIFAVDGYEELYSGIEELVAAYDAAVEVDRNLSGEEGQAIIDALVADLLAAIEGAQPLDAELKLFDTTENGSYADIPWTTFMSEMIEPDYDTGETYRYIGGLVFDYYDGIETLVGGQGGLTYEYEPNPNSSGALATGDKLTLSDGTTVYLVLFGDANGDCIVDSADITDAADMYNWVSPYSSANNAYFYGADLIADGMVDAVDIGYMADVYNWVIDPYSVPQDGTYLGL